MRIRCWIVLGFDFEEGHGMRVMGGVLFELGILSVSPFLVLHTLR